jgi:serine/threonine protein kinase
VTAVGEVKVADFGLARVLHAGDGVDLTQDGMTLGTPLYMSPEQAEGKRVDARSDLYSLGATVYHLLAGRPPFDGTTSLAVAMAHIKDSPTPLSSLRPDLPAELIAIVDRLLAKDPAGRYPSPGDMLRAVEPIERALDAGSRARPSPLVWPADVEWDLPVAARRSVATPVRSGPLHDATARLQASMEREQLERESSRRVWMATAAAALTATVAGFMLGRARPRAPRTRPTK